MLNFTKENTVVCGGDAVCKNIMFFVLNLLFEKSLLQKLVFAVQSVLHYLAGVESCFLKLSEEPKWRNNNIQNQYFLNFIF